MLPDLNGTDSGASPEAESTVNAKGGLQSKLTGRYDLLGPKALVRLAGVLGYGATKYAPNNWRAIDEPDHLNHALMHIFHHIGGDRSDDHLGHAFCRLMMAIETEDPSYDYLKIELGAAKKSSGGAT